VRNKDQILQQIKSAVLLSEPDATIILYGSYARGDQKPESDIDLLILLNREKITFADEKRIAFPLYDIEFETGQIISPVVLARRDWETRHRITPFYENVTLEGIVL
jgi:predicted nucleotidyltransferase